MPPDREVRASEPAWQPELMAAGVFRVLRSGNGDHRGQVSRRERLSRESDVQHEVLKVGPVAERVQAGLIPELAGMVAVGDASCRRIAIAFARLGGLYRRQTSLSRSRRRHDDSITWQPASNIAVSPAATLQFLVGHKTAAPIGGRAGDVARVQPHLA